MTMPVKRELFVVVADLDAENVIRTLLKDRQEALDIELDFAAGTDLLRYTGRDCGCRTDAVKILRRVQETHDRALIIFDHHGSGSEDTAAPDLEGQIEKGLARSGWLPQRVAAIVIDPELEAWVWSGSPQVSKVLGWKQGHPALRGFLAAGGHWPAALSKPPDPKKALEEATRRTRTPRVSSLFSDLAATVSVKGCSDRAFLKLTDALRKWFPRAAMTSEAAKAGRR